MGVDVDKSKARELEILRKENLDYEVGVTETGQVRKSKSFELKGPLEL